MNVIAEIRRILNQLNWDVDLVDYESSRKPYPTAGFLKSGLHGKSALRIVGGKTALARWGLFEILMHEYTHYLLMKEGYPKWKEHDDVFAKKYFEVRRIFETLVD